MKTIIELKKLLAENEEKFWDSMLTTRDEDYTPEALVWMLHYATNNKYPEHLKMKRMAI